MRVKLKDFDNETECTRNSFMVKEFDADSDGKLYQRQLLTGHIVKKNAENVLRLMNLEKSPKSMSLLIDKTKNEL